MKKLILTALIFLTPAFVFAASTDVTVSESSVITVGGINLTVSGVGRFDSITVDSGSLSLTMSGGSLLVLTSSDKRTFTVSPAANRESFRCDATESILTLSNNVVSTVIVTVTPSSSTCVGGGGGSGGGGGGGGGYTAPVVPPQTQPAQISQVLPKATPTAPAVAQPSATAVSVSPVFTRSFNVGTISSDVKRLQQVLNSDSDTRVAASGAGSAGKETNYFGPATRKAVQKFQCKYKIICSGTPAATGYGNLGPKTRAKIQEIFKITGTSVPVNTNAVPTTTPVPKVETPIPKVETPTTAPKQEVPDFLKLFPIPKPQ